MDKLLKLFSSNINNNNKSLILGLIVLLFMASVAWAETWLEFASDETGAWERIYYIDGDSIELLKNSKESDTNVFRYWYREEYLDPSRPLDHAFLMEADCGKDRYRILKSRELELPNGKEQPWLEEGWYKVTEHVSGELLAFGHICGRTD